MSLSEFLISFITFEPNIINIQLFYQLLRVHLKSSESTTEIIELEDGRLHTIGTETTLTPQEKCHRTDYRWTEYP